MNSRVETEQTRQAFIAEEAYDDYIYSLSSAAAKGQLERLELLLNQRIVIEDYDGALATARNKHEDCYQLLLRYKQASDINYDAKLYVAAESGQLERLKLLLEQGIIPKSYHDQALIRAIKNEKIGCLELLLNHKAVSDEDYNYYAATVAAGLNKAISLEFLLNHRAISDKAYAEAIQSTTKHGHVNCLELLLNHKAVSDESYSDAIQLAITNGHVGCLELLVKTGKATDLDCNNALHMIIDKEDTDCMKLLDHYFTSMNCEVNTEVNLGGSTDQQGDGMTYGPASME